MVSAGQHVQHPLDQVVLSRLSSSVGAAPISFRDAGDRHLDRLGGGRTRDLLQRVQVGNCGDAPAEYELALNPLSAP